MSLILSGNSGSMTVDSTTGVTFPNGTNPQAAPSKVLQVVTGSTSTSVTNNTTTPADTGLTATITPLFSTSKILVIFSQNGLVKNSDNSNNGINIKLFRNSTDLGTLVNACCYTGSALQNRGSATASVYDSPATTSATTYKTQFFNVTGSTSVLVNEGPATSSITLMEIAQ